MWTLAKKRSRSALGTGLVKALSRKSRTNGNRASKPKRTVLNCALEKPEKSTPNQLRTQTSAWKRPSPTLGEAGSSGSVRTIFSKKMPSGGLVWSLRMVSPIAAARPASTSSRRAWVLMVTVRARVSRKNPGRVRAHSSDGKTLGMRA